MNMKKYLVIAVIAFLILLLIWCKPAEVYKINDDGSTTIYWELSRFPK